MRPPTKLIFREYASGLYSRKSLARKLDADTYVRAVIRATKTNESAPSEGGSERKTGLLRINPPSLTAEAHIHFLLRAA